MTKPIPDGYHSLTPSLMFKDAKKAVEFYKKAFGAQQLSAFPGKDGGILHGEIKIGDSILMLGDQPDEKGTPASEGDSNVAFTLYVPDVDRVFKQALAAGAKQTMPVTDMFWGDRAGCVTDPFGYNWWVMTHTKDMTMDEIKQAMEDSKKATAGKN